MGVVMNLLINGEKKQVENVLTIEDLIKVLELSSERLAVELNLKVIRRTDWQEIKLTDGDKLEIIHFVGGG